MLKGNPFSRQLITILSILTLSLALQTANSEELIAKTNPSNVRITRNIATMPLAFTANNGQWDDKVKFRANANGATMWFASDGAYYQFTRTIESSASQTSSSYPDVTLSGQSPAEGVEGLHEPDSVETMMIKATFVGANLNPQMIGVDMMDYKCNYFIGNDPNEWHTDVRNYSAVLYEEIYDGIDLKYYGNGRQMEYDFIVSPGADYAQIEIQYEGAESISINDNGQLVIETKWGEVVEQTPVIYQVENNSRITIDGKFKMKGDNSFGFELSSSYNPSLPLVIDPVLIYSTYLGGNSSDIGTDIAVDILGNAYITGSTNSTDFPTMGEFQTDQTGVDVMVTKLNATGNSLVYSTYIGGNGLDHGTAIAVDSAGNAYITGRTSSTNFPTLGEYQTDQPEYDVFATKLNSSGNALLYSTYLGGNNDDFSEAIALDSSGNAYITGYTYSPDFPTASEYQTYQGGVEVFVTKLNSTGNALVYSTYLGGSGPDVGLSIALDGSNNAYITGYTFSTDFPTLNPYQGTPQGGFWDAFVTKLSVSGNSLVYSTYLGGSKYDQGYGIAVDNSGNAYIIGFTDSPDFPTLGEYQTFQGTVDVFVTKLNSSGNALVYSTYLGGSGYEQGLEIALDGSRNAYLTGYTWSTDFPVKGEYQTYQASFDAFVTKLDSSGNALVYSTYLGGSGPDAGTGIKVDDSGYAYISGWTESVNFPTAGEYQTFQNVADVFITKFSSKCCAGNRGDLNGDGDDANILDLTFLVDYIFRGSGDPGPCPDEADVNGDGDSASILDLTYLVDFIFRGGPPPGPC